MKILLNANKIIELYNEWYEKSINSEKVTSRYFRMMVSNMSMDLGIDVNNPPKKLTVNHLDKVEENDMEKAINTLESSLYHMKLWNWI